MSREQSEAVPAKETWDTLEPNRLHDSELRELFDYYMQGTVDDLILLPLLRHAKATAL